MKLAIAAGFFGGEWLPVSWESFSYHDDEVVSIIVIWWKKLGVECDETERAREGTQGLLFFAL